VLSAAVQGSAQAECWSAPPAIGNSVKRDLVQCQKRRDVVFWYSLQYYYLLVNLLRYCYLWVILAPDFEVSPPALAPQ